MSIIYDGIIWQRAQMRESCIHLLGSTYRIVSVQSSSDDTLVVRTLEETTTASKEESIAAHVQRQHFLIGIKRIYSPCENPSLVCLLVFQVITDRILGMTRCMQTSIQA